MCHMCGPERPHFYVISIGIMRVSRKRISGGAGTRAPYRNGDSLVITLPKDAIEREGIEPDELVGRECWYVLDDGELVIDVEGAVN